MRNWERWKLLFKILLFKIQLEQQKTLQDISDTLKRILEIMEKERQREKTEMNSAIPSSSQSSHYPSGVAENSLLKSDSDNVSNEDVIYRQAAKDAVEHITSSMSVCANSDECHGMKRMQRQAVIELTNLPSAQPEVTAEMVDSYVKPRHLRVISEEFYLHLTTGKYLPPTFQPTQPERKTGKWLYDGDCYICNQCKSAFSWWADSQTSNYCPNCGADMRGEQE